MNFFGWFVCLFGLLAEWSSKTSANFRCCSYCALVIILICVKIVTTLPGLLYLISLITTFLRLHQFTNIKQDFLLCKN